MKLIGKLWLTLGISVLATTIIVSLGLLRWLETRALDQRHDDLLRASVLLSEIARPTLTGEAEPARLQERIKRLGADVHTRFTVIDRQGRVLADSRQDPTQMDDHSGRPEVVRARTAGEGSATRHSRTLGARLLYVAMRVDDPQGTLPLGYVRSSVPLAALDRQLREVRQVAVAAGGLGVLLVMVIGYLTARRLTYPLEAMTAAARSLADGQQRPLPVAAFGGDDELATLAQAFDSMARQLGERLETIEADRAKLTAILGNMTEGLIAVDREGRIVHINAVAGELLDTDPTTALGLKVPDVTRIEPVAELLSKTLLTLEPTTFELALDALPAPRHMILRTTPAWDSGGELLGALLVILDQTELRRLENVRRDFVANVSHELKTPLTALLAQLETLSDRPELERDARQRFVERGLKQAGRLSTLVQDLLALSRIESTDTTRDFEQIDLRDPVTASISGMSERAEEKPLELRIDLPEEPLQIRGDPEYLRQVVDNLLSNAIMYTPAEGWVEVRLRRHGDQAVLEVQDTGIGIPRAERERIFERFYRVDRARSRDLGGTGLGLAIVKHLVLAHSGKVEVDGSVGRGSTFRVTLPLSEPAPSSPDDDDEPSEAPTQAALSESR